MYSNITNGTISVRCLSQQNKNLQQFLAELENWELNASNSVISFPPQTKFQEIFVESTSDTTGASNVSEFGL